MHKINIELFSDMLCIWAYGAQIRIDQIDKDFPDQVAIQYRFIPVFAAARQRIENEWKDKNGYTGFNRHLKQIASQWDHVAINRNLWLNDAPRSSSLAHLYVKSLQLCIDEQSIHNTGNVNSDGRSLLEEFIWRIRCAFFQDAENISDIAILDALAGDLDLPLPEIHKNLANGGAHAALHLDMQARDRYMIPGSPTLVFNEGRQRLYGNIGYRIIEANIRELLQQPHYGGASWC